MSHRKPTTRRIKRGVWFKNFGTAAQAKCHWCPALLTFDEATIDHEPPLAEGGNWRVAVISCWLCNQERGRATDRRLKAARAKTPMNLATP